MRALLVSHGTRSAEGAARITSLVDAVRAAVTPSSGEESGTPELEIVEAHVDVHPPYLEDVVGHQDRVVPLLLAPGYHTQVDIAEACKEAGAVVSPVLGPDSLLTSILFTRLGELEEDAVVVLAAAGSSVEVSDLATRACADELAIALRRKVHVGYGASAKPSLEDTLASLRERYPDRPIVAASYLLAPGHFLDKLNKIGFDRVTDPLLDGHGVDPRLVELVKRRIEAANRNDLFAA